VGLVDAGDHIISAYLGYSVFLPPVHYETYRRSLTQLSLSTMAALSTVQTQITRLTTPLHPIFPFPLIDLFGAMRLSSVVDWMASGAMDPPTAKPAKKARPSLLQELFGIMVIVFGGETFLCT